MGVGRKGGSKSEHHSFCAEVEDGRRRTCHNCGEEGHFKREWPGSPENVKAFGGGRRRASAGSNGEVKDRLKMETVLRSEVDKENVLLQVMKIPQLDSKDSCESVLWDTACTGVLVRTEHAKRMNFPYEE